MLMLRLFKRKDPPMWLMAGLGNPGDRYAGNRHNIGFMALDAIAEEWGAPPFRAKFQGQVSEVRPGGEKVLLLKPQTYMNNSGQSVAAAAKFYKIDPDRIIVFYDELDLVPGKIRVKKGGGSAGHNGIKSIAAHLGTPEFLRVRMGIGHPGDKAQVTNYVLGNFAKADQAWLAPLLESCARHAPLLLEGCEGSFMTKVAGGTACPA